MTVVMPVAVAIEGVVGLTVVAMAFMELLMKNSVKKLVGAWCGAALQWKPGGFSSPFESQYPSHDGPLPRSSE